MIISEKQIESFIPIRPPFIMVDQVEKIDNNIVFSSFVVSPDNIFADGNFLKPYALIEHIAQSGALGIAYLNRNSENASINGFMGGISKLNIFELPSVHDKINSQVEIKLKFDNMYLLEGHSFVGNKKLISCRIKVVGDKPPKQ